MNSERWLQIKDAFAAMVDMTPADRSSALAELCGNDPELKSEVERLLSQHDEMGGFLEGTSSDPGTDFPQHMFQPEEMVASRYRIVEFLGSGGMGEVYAAKDQDLNEQIAIKIIRQEASFDPNIVERLRREVQLARRVTHPNVCRVFDLGHHQQHGKDVIFLTMELIRGETLATRLKREGKVNPAEALLIAVQLCEALDAAHQAGILHRDFKTSNVILAGQGDQLRAVITDFGIARLLSRSTDPSGVPVSSAGLTHGMVIGTPAYMSPEQLLGEELTVASDIYSLGLVLYEMVTGHRPFEGESSWTETLKRLSAPPKPPMAIVHELGPKWNLAILRCLQRDPAKRFPSAHALAAFLTAKGSITPVLRSRKFQVAAACLIFTIAAAGFVWHDRIWPPSLPEQKHVAVLPFRFQGADSANQATAYELAESLTANLSRLQASDGSLWVVPWSEVSKQKGGDAARAASALGVNLLVIGQLQKAGGKFHLLTQLQDGASLKELRSRSLEIPESQVVTLEDKLLEQTASMLQVQIPAETLHHLPVDATTEPSAYEFYEQGRGYLLRFSQGTPGNLDLAISLLQEAIKKDSHFALAYANLAYAYGRKFQTFHDPQWLEKAKPVCQQALALNNKLAPAHLALALIHEETGDQDGAIREYEKALQLDPSDDATMNHLSLAYDKAGRPLQAEALLKDALKRTPGSWLNYDYLGFFYYQHAEYAQAEPLFRTATELAPDNPLAFYDLGGVYLAECKIKEAENILAKGTAIRGTAGAYSNLATVHQYQGRYLDAASMFQKATELLPNDNRVWCNLGTAFGLAGESTKAREAYAKAVALAEKAVALRPRDATLLGRLSLYYAKSGEKAKAREELGRALRFSQNEPELLFNSALVYELIGEREHALAALRSAIRAGYSVCEIQNAPELTELRQDRRYPVMRTGEASRPN